jgi:hypothetical protein
MLQAGGASFSGLAKLLRLATWLENSSPESAYTGGTASIHDENFMQLADDSARRYPSMQKGSEANSDSL